MSGETNWGPEIAVDGKRPEWLGGDPKKVQATNRDGCWLEPTINGPFDIWRWEWIKAIRLPADHPHYAAKGLDTTDTLLQLVDWSAPIEAVHEDGRVKACRVIKSDGGRMPWLVEVGDYANLWSRPDGFTGTGWRIRNVAQATETGSTAPSGGEVGLEVVERMIALVRGISGGTSMSAWLDHTIEAQAIVSLLPEPVDADRVEAQRLSAIWEISKEAAFQILRRGRALEKGEAA